MYNISIYDYVVWLIPLAVSFYTLSYALWLWRKKKKSGAVGVGLLALAAAVYPALLLFLRKP